MILLRCYPKITDWLFEFSGHAIDLRFLPFFSYGAMVAMGFLAAAIIVTLDLKRKEKLGIFTPEQKTETVGKPLKIYDLIINFIFSFLVFFKIGGFFIYKDIVSKDPIAYLTSTNGSFFAGILAAVAFTAYAWYENKKQQLPEPKEIVKDIFPSDKVGELVFLAAIFGITGAALFNFFEDPSAYVGFWSDPVSYLFSGLSVFGGMICAGLAIWIYASRNKMPKLQLFDTLAIGFILAVGIGRLGCQISGDADWGIVNTAPKPTFIPQFLWADNYAHNIANEGVEIPNCTEAYCKELIPPVYPTPIYEFLQCSIIFLILWSLRKRFTNTPGVIFLLFCVLTGIQRYTIEQIRAVSSRDLYRVLGLDFKQAELISIAMIIAGIGGLVYLYFYYRKKTPEHLSTF